MHATHVENRFYAITRWFGLALASLAFVATILLLIVGAVNFAASPDTDMRTPEVSYNDIRETLAVKQERQKNRNRDTTLDSREREAKEAADEVAFERRLKPYLQKILSNLEHYAQTLGIGKPSEVAVGNYVRGNMGAYDNFDEDEIRWDYVEQLTQASKELSNDAKRIAALPEGDERRIGWPDFLKRFSKAYGEQVIAELNRLDREESRAAMDRATAPIYFYVAAGVFVTFVFFTMLLVLLRIERNTRGKSK